MKVDIIPFLLYLLLFSFIITRIPFLKKSGIAWWLLVGLFVLKVFAGVAYGMYFNFPAQRAGADTWRFYRESLPETELLLHNPLLFVKSLFMSNYAERGGLFSGSNSYWNDLKDNLIIKFLAICNVFSRTNYFTNILFFNFLHLFGLVAFYRLVRSFTNVHQYLLLIPIFLMPSFLFWGSGIHKDGILLSALGMFFYCFNRVIKKESSSKHYLMIAFSFLLIFFIKSYVAIALFPAVLSWWLADRNNQRHQFYFFAVYSGGILALMAVALLGDHYNALFYVANKQHEFLLLKGNSAINVPTLMPTTESVIHYLPTALDVAFIRPHFSEIKNIAYLMAFGETLFNACILIAFLIFAKHKRLMPPFYICCLYLALSVLLLDGFTVTFTGAIVRYRSLMLPILITPLVAMIPFSSLGKEKKRG